MQAKGVEVGVGAQAVGGEEEVVGVAVGVEVLVEAMSALLAM